MLNFRHIHQKKSSHRKKAERVVFKSGQYNLEKSASKYHVFPDIVTAFVEARWRWTLVYCFVTYMTIWLAFAGVWWLILYVHGDLQTEHLPHGKNSSDWTPCVREIYDFTSIFLFSIEIHTTIGYGTRSLTLECPEAMLTMCIESILGTIIQSFIIGIVFAKLTRPKNRAKTLLFSKNAIINQRDRNLCLIFRVGNTRKSRIIAAKIYAYLIRYIVRGCDVLNYEQIKLDIVVDSSEDIFFMFPVCAIHKIDEKSPFYSMSAHDMLKSKLEILVVFEGTIESTGQPVQAKSSYTTHEILWGHRFLPLMTYRRDKYGFVIDYSQFDETRSVNTPLCSAKHLKDFYKSNEHTKSNSTISNPTTCKLVPFY